MSHSISNMITYLSTQPAARLTTAELSHDACTRGAEAPISTSAQTKLLANGLEYRFPGFWDDCNMVTPLGCLILHSRYGSSMWSSRSLHKSHLCHFSFNIVWITVFHVILLSVQLVAVPWGHRNVVFTFAPGTGRMLFSPRNDGAQAVPAWSRGR